MRDPLHTALAMDELGDRDKICSEVGQFATAECCAGDPPLAASPCSDQRMADTEDEARLHRQPGEQMSTR